MAKKQRNSSSLAEHKLKIHTGSKNMRSIERLNLDKHREGTSGQRSSKHLKKSLPTSHVRQINPFNTIGG